MGCNCGGGRSLSTPSPAQPAGVIPAGGGNQVVTNGGTVTMPYAMAANPNRGPSAAAPASFPPGSVITPRSIV